jgi:hypothetical protein
VRKQFFVTCIVSQLVYSSRSLFKGGNGSMMIEIVVSFGACFSSHFEVGRQPFLHSMVYQITSIVGEDKPRRVIATVMVAFALSSVLSGVVFFSLGLLKYVPPLFQTFNLTILQGRISARILSSTHVGRLYWRHRSVPLHYWVRSVSLYDTNSCTPPAYKSVRG